MITCADTIRGTGLQPVDPFRMVAMACVLAVTIACPPAGQAFLYENAAELSSTGDFDGNGRADVVLVDRATGTYRVGYQLAPGSFTWVAPRASGIQSVAGLGVGRLITNTTDALVFTSPEANRLNVFSANDPAAAGLPRSLFSPAIGPSVVIAIDIGGSGNTPLDDFVVGSVLNSAQAFQLEALRNQGNLLQLLSNGNLTGPPRRGNRVTLKTGNPVLAALLMRSGANDLFKAYQVTDGALTEVLSATVGPPFELDYTFGFFDSTSPLAQFIFYKPGTNGVRVRPVQEVSGTFTLATGPVFDLGDNLQHVFTLMGTAPRLLVIFADGVSARIYQFDGSNFPVPLQSFTPAPGEHFTGAAALEDGDVALLSGAAGGGISSRFESYSWNGSSYTLQFSTMLPSVSGLSQRANVMTFQYEPFVSPLPNLLQSFNAGDWASLYVPQPGLQAQVTYETFVQSQVGLGNPNTQTLSPIHTEAQFWLVNQYREPISFFRATAAMGNEIADVSILPAPGMYKTSVQVSFMTANPQSRVYYRLSPTAGWTMFTEPFWLFKDTTVSFYGSPLAVATPFKSAIRQAAYHFTELPQNLDSDGDGVPDYVEIASGLDPVNSGNDGDGDGYMDLDELAKGTDPADANDYPPNTDPRQDLHGAVDLVQAPQAVDGVSGAAVDCAHGSVLRAFDLAGDLLSIGSATLVPLPGLSGPAAVLSNVVVDADMKLVTVATEPHFDIVTAQADKRMGRELLRLLDTVDFVDPVWLPRTWSGGDLTGEANAWIAAASNQLQTVTRKQIIGNLGAYDTLAALLVERKLTDILLSRNQTAFSNLTLFPFRANDAGRPALNSSNLLALQARTTNGLPGFQLRQLLGTIEAALSGSPPSDPAQQLKVLAWEIYRVSSASNNPPANAVDWPFFPSPLDTLRAFLVDGYIHSNYLASSAILSGLAPAATAQAQAILASVTGRPVVTLDMKIRPDTLSGTCVLLDTLESQTRSLVQANGTPYEFLDSFDLPVGTVLSIVGYDDVLSAPCGAVGLEVISVSMSAAPDVSSIDSDGDLLPDALELALFGDLSKDGFMDSDGDGFKNLQEIFDGTDPNNSASEGAQIVNFTLPSLQLQVSSAGQIKLQFQWPAAYAGNVQFAVLGAPDLNGPFNQVPAVQTVFGNNLIELTLPNPSGSTFFYKLLVGLK